MILRNAVTGFHCPDPWPTRQEEPTTNPVLPSKQNPKKWESQGSRRCPGGQFHQLNFQGELQHIVQRYSEEAHISCIVDQVATSCATGTTLRQMPNIRLEKELVSDPGLLLPGEEWNQEQSESEKCLKKEKSESEKSLKKE